MDRRHFLRSGALAVAGLAAAPSLLGASSLGASPLGTTPLGTTPLAAWPPTARRKTLVCVLLRGGADGLHLVVPHGDPAYRALRPTIAIAPPGAPAGALDLDGFFGLHPALAPLHPLYQRGLLAAVHAAGMPTPLRSHSDAQACLESGRLVSSGEERPTSGWLNRVLGAMPGRSRLGWIHGASPLRAVAITPRPPAILDGEHPAVVLQGAAAGAGDVVLRRDGRTVARAASSADAAAPRELREALTLLRAATAPAPGGAGAAYPRSDFGERLRLVGQLVAADVGVEIVFVEMAGWDTHVHQGGATGQLAARLDDFARSVAALATDLGPRMNDVVLLTMSEFGRSAGENRSGGTEHGHAGALLVLGGAVKGRAVYGRWPGLEASSEAGALAATTDVRAVFAEVAARHLGVRRPAALFPGDVASPAHGLGVL